MNRKKIISSLIINIYIVVSVLFCLVIFAVSTGQGNMQVHGFAAFRYYTVDSNFLMAVAAVFLIFHQLKQLKDPAHKIPRWIELFSYITTSAVSITFVTVCVILGPAAGFLSMFTGMNFLLHLINPLAAIISFMFLSADHKLSWKESLLSFSTSFIYGIIYFIMVIIVKRSDGGWPDFYYFNANGTWYLSFIIMQILGYAIGLGLRAVHNITYKRIHERE